MRDAERALADGRIYDAWDAAALAVAELPASAEAHRLQAEAAFLTMRTTPGVAAAARARELAPQDPRVHLVAAYLDQARFRNVAAIASAREAVRLDPGAARYRVALGELLLGGGMVGTPDFESAETELREALRLAPDDLRARFGLAKTLVLSGRQAEGEAELDAYLAERPGHAEAHYLRGVARLRRRALEEAAGDFARAIAHAPHESAYWFNAARVSQLLGRKEDADGQRQRFETLRELEKDLGIVELAYHTDSSAGVAGLQYARILAEQGRLRECTILLGWFCLERPALAEAQTLLAEVCVGRGEIAKGRRAARAAIELTPQRIRPYVARTRLELAAGDTSAAVEAARVAAGLGPDDVELQLLLGSTLLEAERWDEAADHFGRLLQANPRLVRARGGLGQALVGAGRPAEGLAELAAALQVRPQTADWLYSRGVALESEGNLGAAQGSLRSAVAIRPDHRQARTALAEVLRRLGKASEAKRMEADAEEWRLREAEIASLREERADRPLEPDLARRLADLLGENGDAAGAARARAEADTPVGLP